MSVDAANTNDVTYGDIQRVYVKLSLSLPLFLSTECVGEERAAIAGALILAALHFAKASTQGGTKW